MGENKMHQMCYTWFHNTFPGMRGLLCYNLNNSRNKIQGTIDKGLGLQKGRSDLVLYYKGKAYMIELKTDEGRQSKEQIKWQHKIEKAGFDYKIIRSFEEFQSYLFDIIE